MSERVVDAEADVPDMPTLTACVCGDCGAIIPVGWRQKHAEHHGKQQWVYGDV